MPKKKKWKSWIEKCDQQIKTHDQHVPSAYHWYKDASTEREWIDEAKRKRYDLPHIKIKKGNKHG